MSAARLLLCAVLLRGAGQLSAAEPLPPDLIRHIPADARVLAGIHMASPGASTAGRTLLSLLEASYPRLKMLNQFPGFDPARDARQVLLAATGQANANHTLILVRGSLDLARMQAAGLRQESIDGAPVFRPEGDNPAWLAPLERDVVAIGSRESLQRLLARRDSRDTPAADLLAQATELSRRFDLWAVSTTPASELAAAAPEGQLSGILRGDILKSVTETRFGAELGSPVRLHAEVLARSAKDAVALADVVKFFAEVLRFSTKLRDAKAAQAPSDPLGKLETRTEANLVRVLLVIDESLLAGLAARASEIGLR